MNRKLSLAGVALAALVGLVAVAVPALTGPAAAHPDQTLSGPTSRFCARQFEDTVRRFDAAFLAKDLAGFTRFYSEDATAIGTNGAVRDKAGIVANAQALFALDFVATFTTVRQVVNGCDTGVVVTDFLLEVPSRNIRAHFTNNVTFTREKGHWKALVDQSSPLPA